MSNHSLPPPNQRRPQETPPIAPIVIVWLLVVAVFVMIVLPFASQQEAEREIPYSEFIKLVEDGKVAEVQIAETRISVVLKDAADERDGLRSYAPELGDPGLLPLLREHDVKLTNAPPMQPSWLLSVLPWLILLGAYLFFVRRSMDGGFGGPFGKSVRDFLGGSARREQKGGKRVTFDDVAGQDSAKREVAELVDFLRDPERFQRVGAEAPRGILLMGPPGAGKTLLARALAGEAGVPFFSTSASEFIELYVGVGAARVRAMFDEAKQRAPAIVFIDELDSVGRTRGTGLGGGHDEREQTLNQILAEMDGFQGHEAVVVLAATNRPDVLDPALLRPGRFDRHVTLSLPTRDDRLAILGVHTRKAPLAPDVDLSVIAAGTPGFSGADLKNLVNEAAIAAARQSESQIAMRHLDEARDRVMMGTMRTLAIAPAEKHRLAVHEAGHASVALLMPKADALYKVTIIPRGQSLGGTHLLPDEERHTLPEDRLRDQLAVMLAGRAAEKAFLGTVSSGADDDIKRATALARAMVARWGMSAEIGPVDLRESDENPFLGREVAQPRRFADQTAAEVDAAVRQLLREAESRALQAIEERRADVERLIRALEAEETLDRARIEACFTMTPPAATRHQDDTAA